MNFISSDYVLKRKLINTEFLHQLLDTLINSVQLETKIIICPLLAQINANLVKIHKKTTYIPGETLENERQRIKVIQHGIIPVFIFVFETSKKPELTELVHNYLFSLFRMDDLKWTLKALPLNRNDSAGIEKLNNVEHIADNSNNLPGVKNNDISIKKLNSSLSIDPFPTIAPEIGNINFVGASMDLAQRLDLWTGKEIILSK